jgi:hypothetical protein
VLGRVCDEGKAETELERERERERERGMVFRM